MQILQVGTGFAPIPPKGAYATERTIHFLSSALATLGHEVTVLDIEEKNRPPVPYKVEEAPLRWHRDTNLPTHIMRGFAFRQATGSKLKKVLEDHKFDAINFHNQFSACYIDLAHHYNIPVAYSLHNALWYNPWACRSRWQRLKFFQEVKAMKKADIIICQNKTTSLNLTSYFGIPEHKLAIIPLGLDERWFKNFQVSEAIKEQFAPNDEPIVLNVARIAPYKNQLTLAKAIPLVAQKIPEAQFLFVGPVVDKSYYRKVQGVIVEAKVEENVKFLGEIPHAELPQLYSLCKVFACPSASEAFAVVTMEAMAQRKAVVASDLEPFQEILGKGRGVIIPAYDHKSLAEAIINLLENCSLREEMGQQAKEYVRIKYTWENVVRKTLKIYEGMLREDRK